jgi:hypothetical protein
MTLINDAQKSWHDGIVELILMGFLLLSIFSSMSPYLAKGK